MTDGITLLHAVEECLQNAGYPYERADNTYQFRLVASSHVQYAAEAVVFPREAVVQLFIYLETFIPAQRHAWFRELVSGLNNKLAAGAFLVRWADCAFPCYRITDFFQDHPAIAQTVRRFLNRADFGLRLFEEVVKHLYTDIPAQQAVETASSIVLDEPNRLYMKLLHGDTEVTHTSQANLSVMP